MSNAQKTVQNVFLVILIAGICFVVGGIGCIMGSYKESVYGFTVRDYQLAAGGGMLIGVGVVTVLASLLYRQNSLANLKDEDSSGDVTTALKQLKNLYEDKVINKDEYEERKKKILDRM